MSASVTQQPQEGLAPQAGGISMSQRVEKFEPKFKPLGVLYAKLENGTVEFVVVYEAHVEQIVKDEIAARFGAGAKEWRP